MKVAVKSNEKCLSHNLSFVLDKQTILPQSSEDLSYSCRKMNLTKEHAFKWLRFVSIFINNMQYKVNLENILVFYILHY